MVFIILRTQYYTIFLFTGFLKREHEVPDPDTMFSVSSAESQNELVFHQMQRIVDNDLLQSVTTELEIENESLQSLKQRITRAWNRE